MLVGRIGITEYISHIDIWFMIGYPFLLVKYSRSEQKNADISTAFPHHLTHVNNPPT